MKLMKLLSFHSVLLNSSLLSAVSLVKHDVVDVLC